jgi:hypothetical protein
LTLEIKTATENHFNLNFKNRFKKYLKFAYELNDRAKRGYLVDRIFKDRVPNPSHPSKFDNDPVLEEIINKYQELFNHPDQDTLIVDNLKIYLPFYLKFLKCFEQKEERLFTLAPTQGTLIPSHIKICTNSLHEILAADYNKKKKLWNANNQNLKEKIQANKLRKKQGLKELKLPPKKEFKVPKPVNKSQFRNEKDLHWDQITNYRKYENVSHWFDWQILTDGYSVSVTFKSPLPLFKYSYKQWLNFDIKKKIEICLRVIQANKEKKNESRADIELKIDNYDQWLNHLGLDPGGRSLFTTCDDDGNILQCSSREYKHLTGQKKRLKKINRIKDASKDILSLNKATFKVSNPEAYSENLLTIFNSYNKLETEYGRDIYRKMKFTCYQNKQKTFKILANRLAGKYRGSTIIGYGNGGVRRKGIRGCGMPVSEFNKYLKHRCGFIYVYDINEWGTTVNCNGCRRRTVDVYVWEEKELPDGTTKRIRRKIYGLRRCNNNECSITWNRDVNASKNIRFLLERELKGLERPKYLCPQPKPKTKLDQETPLSGARLGLTHPSS